MVANRPKNRENAEKGLSKTFDRRNKFFIKRFKNSLGLEVYLLENKGLGEKIYIDRQHFDRFRSSLYKFSNMTQYPPEIKLRFREKEHYSFKVLSDNESILMIYEHHHDSGSSGSLQISMDALPCLISLLYADSLDHPNDALDQLCQYHSLFQFTFAEGSESMTSNLLLRNDILSQLMKYQPKMGLKVTGHKSKNPSVAKPGAAPRSKAKSEFKPRLGEKDSVNKLKVNYESLFDRTSGVADKTPKAADSDAGGAQTGATKTTFPIPILASEVKNLTGSHFVCQFNQEEVQEFRELFLKDRSAEFFLGIEIIDAIFRKASGLKTFRFPLYYMKVTLEESGRDLFIHPDPEGRLFLNHLALANLVESFAPFTSGTGGTVASFFDTLMAQTIKITGRDDRIRLVRRLPVEETIFGRIRELLLGFEGEDGRGGLLGHLKLVGMEADLEGVNLYKAAKNDAPLVAALSSDLATIRYRAHIAPNTFYGSLLGQFLTPEKRERQVKPFSNVLAMPGIQPKSIRSLVDKLNNHDLVLLEGPPGTGKTFSILNLVIHSMITGKKLLVVSDKQAAIHALTEKITEYLVGRELQTSQGQHLKSLFDAAVKVVDKAPLVDSNLSSWSRDLKDQLKVLEQKFPEWPTFDEEGLKEVHRIDERIEQFKKHIDHHMNARLGAEANYKKRVAPKRNHATTVHDIEELTEFLAFITSDSQMTSGLVLLKGYIEDREILQRSGFREIYQFFQIPEDLGAYKETLERTLKYLTTLIKRKPRSTAAFENLFGSKVRDHEIIRFFHHRYLGLFPPGESSFLKGFRFVRSLFSHKILNEVRLISRILSHHLKVIDIVLDQSKGVVSQLVTLHHALAMYPDEPVPLCLEICRFAIDARLASDKKSPLKHNPTVHESLSEIERLMNLRDKTIKKMFVGRLGEIGRQAYTAQQSGSTSRVTSIGSLLDNLKTYSSVDAAQDVLAELREHLLDSFPVWICRKQAVPFLFPCQEGLFDLVIVDEATQCRVDDALPLLYRAQKIMVVGDEKQTVLAKDSVIDDFLFSEHDLHEHLVNSQAMGIKGGGSHIFGLVKSIKQASVMLDEHYRCPPNIIEFSNHYVYHDELKTMQWSHKGAAPSVVVDYSENKESESRRVTSGKFKGLETDMVDRFFDFVGKTVKKIEKETGRRINTETDLALCYFLLKNEPYVKEVKGSFLEKLNRGQDILDGAGAALQGKERDYIFYLWDINKGNIAAFRQGDDPDKRKGELNVLMSRPKVRAYHFLHKNFQELDHKSANIVDYLWKTYLSQKEKTHKYKFINRVERPGSEFIPWRRSSGQLMEAILEQILSQHHEGFTDFKSQYSSQNGVVVGDPFHKVDVVFYSHRSENSDEKVIGVVDLSDFGGIQRPADEIVDYYFQCLRAKPAIRPFFLFIHELATPGSRSLEALKASLLGRQSFRDEAS